MSKYLQKYLDYQDEWSKLALAGKMQEYEALGKKADEECYPNFDEEDWDYLINSASMPQAKITYYRLKQKYLGESEKRK